MKFLNCLRCNDIVLMCVGRIRVCLCGLSKGLYIDRRQAEYSGPARVLGMLNGEYADSLHTDGSEKINYRWFVIPEGHNILKVEKLSLRAAEEKSKKQVKEIRSHTETINDILCEAKKILEDKNGKPKNSFDG